MTNLFEIKATRIQKCNCLSMKMLELLDQTKINNRRHNQINKKNEDANQLKIIITNIRVDMEGV